MTGILETVAEATNHSRTLLDQAASSAEREKERREISRAENLKQRRADRDIRKYRLSKALAGIASLLDFAQNQEVCELLTLRGKLFLRGMNDSASDSTLYLAADGLHLETIVYGINWGHNESIIGRGAEDPETSTRIKFQSDDTLLTRVRLLTRVWSPYPIDLTPESPKDDPDDAHYRQVQIRDAQPEDIFFQILVDCADKDKFERYVRNALA